ncbi:MAG: hypothetical protein GF388_03885 [Candidatus Aegiribacteria sp.]|nr:hypothetical protein [Candidatus Aegiribacteria sp.]MBD3294394.1 hypothetical protein [Candidatus Fermentibacteria bacterium]
MDISRLKIVTASAAVLFLACSFFEPRDPQDPAPGDDIPWQQPYAPTTVVTNLGNAMEGRSASITMACCDSSYMFIADESDTTEFGGSWNFGGWTYEVEQNTVMNIFNFVQSSGYPDDSLVSVTMNTISTLPDPVAPSDSAEIWRDYQIVAAGTEYADWDAPAEGRVMFLMVEDSYGLWSIKRWYDYRPEDYTGEHYTWGVAKAPFR